MDIFEGKTTGKKKDYMIREIGGDLALILLSLKVVQCRSLLHIRACLVVIGFG